jgi:hypothetical protein
MTGTIDAIATCNNNLEGRPRVELGRVSAPLFFSGGKKTDDARCWEKRDADIGCSQEGSLSLLLDCPLFSPTSVRDTYTYQVGMDVFAEPRAAQTDFVLWSPPLHCSPHSFQETHSPGHVIKTAIMLRPKYPKPRCKLGQPTTRVFTKEFMTSTRLSHGLQVTLGERSRIEHHVLGDGIQATRAVGQRVQCSDYSCQQCCQWSMSWLWRTGMVRH